MARKKSASPSIRTFRANVAKLKKLGVIPASVDARKAQPNRSLNAKISANKDLLAGRAQSIKRSRVELTNADIKQRGWKIAGKGKDAIIIVPTRESGEYAEVVKDPRLGKRTVKFHHFDGTTRISLPSDIRTINDLIREYNANPEKFESMKNSNERFSARIYDNRITKVVFRDLGALIDYLEEYQRDFKGQPGFWIQLTQGRRQVDAFSNLEIVKFPKSMISEWTNKKSRKRK